jgi:MYXO-CTERM domain-containing protein
MRRLSLLRAAGVVVAAVCVLGGAPPASASSDSSLSVGFDKGRVDLVVGDKFTLTSTITNEGAAPSPPVVAHLNVASLTSDVYVDPEDWSSSRSRYLPALAPGQTVDVTWSLQAVNSGWFDVYAVLLPRGASSLGADPLVVSHAVLARVGGKQTANPGGALPAVIGVPVLIGVAALWSRRRRRRPS